MTRASIVETTASCSYTENIIKLSTKNLCCCYDVQIVIVCICVYQYALPHEVIHCCHENDVGSYAWHCIIASSPWVRPPHAVIIATIPDRSSLSFDHDIPEAIPATV